MNIRDGLSFDDVLLVPKYSEVSSRSLVDTSINLGKKIKLEIPIISANMSSITEVQMANRMLNLGGLPILHRFCSIDKEVQMMQQCMLPSKVGCSIGVGEEEKQRAKSLIHYGCRIICIDVAHGDHKKTIEMAQFISSEYPEILLIAGNVATAKGANRLAEAGVDVIKVGIGPGAICSTRVETGNGVPQLTALDDVFLSSRTESGERKYKIIADGGIRSAGDCVKALCFADAVMIGNLLAGTDETPGEPISIDGKLCKEYVGSSTHKSNHIEGVKKIVNCKGSAGKIIQKLLEGIKSGCSYQGVDNINDLKNNPEFVRISNAGLIESHPH